MKTTNTNWIREKLLKGLVIPASPMALTSDCKLDERRQRALWRYYSEAGAGGIAVGVHTTQFAIRDPKIGLFEPILAIANEEFTHLDNQRAEMLLRIAGVCGQLPQAISEAALVRDHGFHAALLSLAALKIATDDQLIDHCKKIADIVPIIGFYLQPAVGGRPLTYQFWRKFLQIENVVAIKIAPFHRYATIDVMRAAAESKREDVALYTGNDDSIIMDLITPYRFKVNGNDETVRMAGGLLGHWAVWTKQAVAALASCKQAMANGTVDPQMLILNGETTDANAALFDAANNYKGCIPGLHEVLRKQGLLENILCLDPNETLSPGQAEEIERVCAAYPHLNDDEFVLANRDRWLTG